MKYTLFVAVVSFMFFACSSTSVSTPEVGCEKDSDCSEGRICVNKICQGFNPNGLGDSDELEDEANENSEKDEKSEGNQADGDVDKIPGDWDFDDKNDGEVIEDGDGVDSESVDQSEKEAIEYEYDKELTFCGDSDGCSQDDNPCTFFECDIQTDLCVPKFVEDGKCEQNANTCSESVCDISTWSCVEKVAKNADCDDGNPCNGDEFCEDLVCKPGTPLECPQCKVCDDKTGDCVCSGDSCDAVEVCNKVDDNCNNKVDEDDVCKNPDVGIRVEMRWSGSRNQLDLHLLRLGARFEYNKIVHKDCNPYNPNPDWGVKGNKNDDPLLSPDITGGSDWKWIDMNPEVVHLALPSEEPYRIMVHHKDGLYYPSSTTVNLKVYMDGELIGEFHESMASRYSFWNVACLNYNNKSAKKIVDGVNNPQISYDNLDDIDPDACSSPGVKCVDHCSCSQGMACVKGECIQGNAPLYCCSNPGCPAAKECYFDNNNTGYCGTVVNFDLDSNSKKLGDKTDVEGLYSSWGAMFYSDRGSSIVSTDSSWELDSVSKGQCASTLDNDGKRWLGNMHIYLVKPDVAASYDNHVKAVTNYASFYIGDTYREGLRVRAYDINGIDYSNADTNKVLDYRIDDTMKVNLYSKVPFHHIYISNMRDKDFVIDDLYIDNLRLIP